MKKVCHITSAHTRYDGRIFRKECSSLARAGYQVFLLVNDSKSDEQLNGVNIVSTGFQPANRKERFLKGGRILYRKVMEVDADLYHLHDPDLLPMGRKLKRKGKAVIFDSHECYEQLIRQKAYLPKVSRGLIANVYKKIETNICSRIDAVILPSLTEGKNSFDGRAKKTVFINNVPIIEGVPYTETKGIGHAEAVCYFGNLEYERGITHLIKACYQAQTKLILCGPITADYFAEIRKIEAYQCVDYRGTLPHEQLPGVMEECFAGMSILLDVGQYWKGDNLPTKVYEYMLHGLPTIMSACPYGKSLFDRYQCGICVDPEEIGQVADAISYLRENKNEARMMGENGRALVMKEFIWSNEEQKLFKLYKEILP